MNDETPWWLVAIVVFFVVGSIAFDIWFKVALVMGVSE